MLNYSKNLSFGLEILGDNITVRKVASCSNYKTLHFMKCLINHFINNPDPMIVPVYNFVSCYKNPRNEYFKYYYDMKRLGILSIKERELINHVGNLYDTFGVTACKQNIPVIWKDEYPELFRFLHIVTSQGRYWDIHSGNILKDEDGYKLIDLEGFLKTPLEQPDNNWIIR